MVPVVVMLILQLSVLFRLSGLPLLVNVLSRCSRIENVILNYRCLFALLTAYYFSIVIKLWIAKVKKPLVLIVWRGLVWFPSSEPRDDINKMAIVLIVFTLLLSLFWSPFTIGEQVQFVWLAKHDFPSLPLPFLLANSVRCYTFPSGSTFRIMKVSFTPFPAIVPNACGTSSFFHYRHHHYSCCFLSTLYLTWLSFIIIWSF